MDYAHFTGCALLGLGPALAIFFLSGAKRRAWIPPLAWWLSLPWESYSCFTAYPTRPSPLFQPRSRQWAKLTTTGSGKVRLPTALATASFRFVPEGGKPINIETEIILPDWGSPADFDGRTFRVVYLRIRGFMTHSMPGRLEVGWGCPLALLFLCSDISVLDTEKPTSRNQTTTARPSDSRSSGQSAKPKSNGSASLWPKGSEFRYGRGFSLRATGHRPASGV